MIDAPTEVLLIAACESVGVALLGTIVVLRVLRRFPLVVLLIGVVAISGLATFAATVTVVLLAGYPIEQAAVELGVGAVSSLVSVGVVWALGRSVMMGGQRLAIATRQLGQDLPFRVPADPPTAELAQLANELAITSEKLSRSRRSEQAADAARRKLVAWISHDLRTPLARLRAVTESMEDGVATDHERSLAQIRADVQRLTDMVDDLFSLSRMQAGVLRLNRRQVALEDLVSDAVAELELPAAERGLRLRAEQIEPAEVSVDDRELTRVFSNLLVNAIRYSRPDGTISLRTSLSGEWAVVSITDECGGIPERDLPFVFEMGWRGDTARGMHGSERGGGLGLAIADGIVRAHEGEVSVHNVPGGCCFEVRLPV